MIIIILKASYYISGSRGGSPLYPLENLNFLHLYIIKLSKNIPRTPPPPFYPPTNLVIPQLSLKRIPGSAHVLPIVLCVSLGGISSYSDTWQITLSNWIDETVIVTSDICCIVTSYFFVFSQISTMAIIRHTNEYPDVSISVYKYSTYFWIYYRIIPLYASKLNAISYLCRPTGT